MDKKKVFELFHEKVEELYHSRFTKALEGSGTTISGVKGQPVKAVRRGPDFEAIKAFAITYRNFSLDTDPISIRNLAKIYEELGDDDEIKQKFVEARRDFNKFLDSPSILKLNGVVWTNRKIVDTYIYGKVIHLEKVEEFNAWIRGSPLSELTYNEIVHTLGTAANFIYYFDSINKEYLDRISE